MDWGIRGQDHIAHPRPAHCNLCRRRPNARQITNAMMCCVPLSIIRAWESIRKLAAEGRRKSILFAKSPLAACHSFLVVILASLYCYDFVPPLPTGVMAFTSKASAVRLVLALLAIQPALGQHSHSMPAPPTPPTPPAGTISAKPSGMGGHSHSMSPGMPMDMPMSDMPGMGGMGGMVGMDGHTHSHTHAPRPTPAPYKGPLYVQGGFLNSTTCTNPKIRKE